MEIITKICPSCESVFNCQQTPDGPCWCSQFIISDEKLKYLEEKYNRCICPDCLQKVSEK